MKRTRVRVPVLLWIAAGVAIPIVVLVALARLMEQRADAPVAESTSTRTATMEESSPTPLESPEGSATRVAAPVPPPRRSGSVPQQTAIAPSPPPSAAANKIRIVGNLRDPSGRPIVTDHGTIWCRTVSGTDATEVKEGAYRLDGLEPGEVGLESQVHGYRRQLKRFVLGPRELEHREDFVLEPNWYLDVQISTPDGRALDPGSARELVTGGQLRFAVSETPPPEHWTPGSTEERRARRLVGDHFGNPIVAESFSRLMILGDPPIYLSVDVCSVVLASIRLETRVDRARLVVPLDRLASLRGSFTCVLLDKESGMPFAQGHARLSPVYSSVGGYVDERLEADPSGRIRRENLFPGRYTLSLRGERAAPYVRAAVSNTPVPNTQGAAPTTWSARDVRSFVLGQGEDVDLGTIELDPSQHVAGRFVDAKGQPVDGRASIRPLSLDDPVDPSVLGADMEVGDLQSDAHGGFVRNGLGKERYVLVANGKLRGNPKGDLLVGIAVVDLREGSVDDLVVTLETAQRFCIRPETEEAKDFVFRLADAAGVPFARGALAQPCNFWLAPGSYCALVGPDVAHFREIPFTLGAEAMTIKVVP